MRYVVIMAGGSGERLWPLSRQDMPKQLLNIVSGKSLLRIAFERLQGLLDESQILVCTGVDYADAVRAELPEIPAANILGEPARRDSLNAVAWPAAILAERDPDAVIAMVSSDQIIHPVGAFQSSLDTAFRVAEQDASALVVCGVVPTTAHTGFGYLHRGQPIDGFAGVCELQAFREKPDHATAEEYLSSGQYWWNCGIFVWRASTLLEQLQILRPETHKIVQTLAAEPARLAELYPGLEKISVDYAVMEPVSQGKGTAHVLAVELPVTWHDVGGFEALSAELPHDEGGNALSGVSVLVDSSNNLVINQSEDGRVVAVVGMTETVIVQTPEITLVCPMSESDRIKQLLAQVTERLGTNYA